jgi:hypothetical protein
MHLKQPKHGETLTRELWRQVVKVTEVTIDEEDLDGSSAVVPIQELPNPARVLGCAVIPNEDFVGLSDLTIKVGGTDDDAIIAETDLDAITTTTGPTNGTAGVYPMGNYSGQTINATIASAAGDMGDLTAGNITIELYWV